MGYSFSVCSITEHSAYLVELCLAYLYKVFQSTNAISLDNSLEDLISSIFVTAKSIVNCFQPKMQKQLVSAALAFLLIGYKGIREVPTDFCFSKLDEYFKYTSLLLIRFIDGEHFDNLIWQILFN
ncbi:protein SWEETIE-like isoform X2 [Rosa rugosa]|uniref:protein SWEETIE-like isoform X2 n=1 Tax=Rosa rugosa TaxID=74645 RepID=UPI002B408363|nr:protein SWEETIE-like isoform X2 [Rosa rugosa]XP_062006878.1 protein SWEETIE-like isoform X2 [Rosa rugosa]XP_062006879.1 protein SWEETIE-like isoform X2 [Rosa rugosa]